MLTLKRLAIYLFTFLITTLIVIVLIDWRRVDNLVLSYANRPAPNDEIVNKVLVFIQLNNHPYGESECESFTQYRQSIIKLLNTIAAETKKNNGPKGIVFDIWFGKDNTELENLKAALQQTVDLKIPVYASYHVTAGNETADISNINFDVTDANHANEIYNNYITPSKTNTTSGNGRYHTRFYAEQFMASYENDLYLVSQDFPDTALIESLPMRVFTDLGESKNMMNNSKRIGSIVPYGNLNEMQKLTHTFIADADSAGHFENAQGVTVTLNMDEKIVIVGDAINDVMNAGNSLIPGPYIFTWALSDLLDNNDRLNLPLENHYLIIGQMISFALIVVMLFALIFKYIKRLQTQPALIGTMSFLLVSVLLLIYYKIILNFRAVIPIGQTVAAMLVAATLAWRFAHKFLVTGVAEGAQKYDVFISYSRNHSQWVVKNVYEPLVAYRKPNGDKLNIFFDMKSIGIGEAFTSKYMWAIVDSKCFISILSEEYYGKNHCRNELDLAYKRSVEKLLSIKMIAFTFKAVPEIYTHINFVDITVNPNFIETIKQELDT